MANLVFIVNILKKKASLVSLYYEKAKFLPEEVIAA